MQLAIDQVLHVFEPLREFRARFDLPEAFSVNYFQPKSYDGLGSIERAGADLNELRRRVLDDIPHTITNARLSVTTQDIIGAFQHEMVRINQGVGLREVEIDFAVSGFADVLQAFTFEMQRARVIQTYTPDFEATYQHWLNQTARIASPVIEYPVHDQVWGVQVIAHAYGRVGLIIATQDDTHYVVDPALACPAEGFMMGLLRDVCAKVMEALIKA